MTPHIRKPLPRKGGNSWYRDTTDYSQFVATLCGEPVSDKDIDIRTARTKTFRASGWPVCKRCMEALDAHCPSERTMRAMEKPTVTPTSGTIMTTFQRIVQNVATVQSQQGWTKAQALQAREDAIKGITYPTPKGR